MTDYILNLDDERAMLAMVGGKGASLARLSYAGFPVPDGFHITTRAYLHFVEQNRLQGNILAAVKDVDVSHPESLESAARSIATLFQQAHIPGEICDAIIKAYEALPADQPAVAVRSSATAEDLPEMSFAGQQETFLNIRGSHSLLEAVRRCWASLWTGRAIAYRLRHNVDASEVRLAVVVQLLVPAGAAGVLFTANPLNKRRDQLLINAAWGLGEAVVGGTVTPDSITVNKENLAVIQRQTAEKRLMTVCSGSGTLEKPVPQSRRLLAVLDDRQASELASLGVRIEQLYGVPSDIEWALADGKFYILQARPITTLSGPEALPPIEWKLPDAKASYMRGSIIDYLAHPLTPLFKTMGRDIYNQGMKKLIEDVFGSNIRFESQMVTINDYAYFTYRYKTWQLLMLIASMLWVMPKLLRSAAERWKNQALPDYQAVVRHWQGKSLEKLSSAELLSGAAAIFRQTVSYLTHIQSGSLGISMFSEAIFSFVYDRFIRRKGGAPTSLLLVGFDSLPIQADKALFDLAQKWLKSPPLAHFLTSASVEEIIHHYRSRQVPASLNESDWHTWYDDFSSYLADYGHNIYDLDFSNPLPLDEPQPIISTFKSYLTPESNDPYRRQRHLIEQRRQAEEAVLRKSGWLRRRLFKCLLSYAQKHVTLREDSIACIGLGYPQLRCMLHELGKRLSQAGAIDIADDVYWLHRDEIEECAALLDRNQPLPGFTNAVLQRKTVWQTEKKITPPPILPQKGKVLGMDGEKMVSARVDDGSDNIIRGVAASPGQVSAPACVLHGPEEFGKMKQGSVLVAAITTPAWTPLFNLASAVVTDIGGPLSHGSIVAREYGIPAVLGTGSATRRIHDGQRLCVDGSAGTVTLEDENAEQPV